MFAKYVVTGVYEQVPITTLSLTAYPYIVTPVVGKYYGLSAFMILIAALVVNKAVDPVGNFKITQLCPCVRLQSGTGFPIY